MVVRRGCTLHVIPVLFWEASKIMPLVMAKPMTALAARRTQSGRNYFRKMILFKPIGVTGSQWFGLVLRHDVRVAISQ